MSRYTAISKCEECGAFTYEHNPKECHSPLCSQATIEEKDANIRYLNQLLRDERERVHKRINWWRTELTSIQGKLRIVIHENNQLRKKLKKQETK